MITTSTRPALRVRGLRKSFSPLTIDGTAKVLVADLLGGSVALSVTGRRSSTAQLMR